MWLVISGSNVNGYINMVLDTLKNSIPKAVVHCQVREAKRSLLNHFYVQVGRREVWVYLFVKFLQIDPIQFPTLSLKVFFKWLKEW